MKRLKGFIAIAMACMIMPVTSNADVEIQGNLGVGPTFFSFSNGDSETETGFGIGAGGIVGYELTRELAFTGGLSFYYFSYSDEESFEFNGQVEEVEYTSSMMTLSVPLGIRYHLTPELYGHISIQPGFVLDRSEEVDGEDVEVEDDHLNDLEVSLPFGVGYRMENGLDLGLTFDPMLSNMVDSDDFTSRRHTLRINAGFWF